MLVFLGSFSGFVSKNKMVMEDIVVVFYKEEYFSVWLVVNFVNGIVFLLFVI